MNVEGMIKEIWLGRGGWWRGHRQVLCMARLRKCGAAGHLVLLAERGGRQALGK